MSTITSSSSSSSLRDDCGAGEIDDGTGLLLVGQQVCVIEAVRIVDRRLRKSLTATTFKPSSSTPNCGRKQPALP